MVNADEPGCTMIDFGIGSPQAALIINCLAYLDKLKAVIMLGMCGGIEDILEVEYLRCQRIVAVDMELATLFSVAYRYEVPIGSIMLISDMPLQKRGIKNKELSERIYSDFMETHLSLARDVVINLSSNWAEVQRKLTSEW